MAADGQDFPSQSPKAPLHAVADYRPADLFADGEADALGGIAVAATSANAAGSVTASFSTNSWGTGQTATYTITNGTP